MNQLTPATSDKPMFGAITIALVTLVIMLVQASTARAQWTNGTNINNTNTGNVGIGTASPGEKLVTIGNTLTGNITNHTQLFSTYDSQDNVIFELGYGTATSDITPLPFLVLSKNLTSSNSAVGSIVFANSSIANGNEKRMSAISTWTDGATNSGMLNFFTTAAGTLSERMRINAAGNVGIGTTSPSAQLHVATAADGYGPLFKMEGTANPGNGATRLALFNPQSHVGLSAYGSGSPGLLANAGGLFADAPSSSLIIGSGANMPIYMAANNSYTAPHFTISAAGSVGIATATPNSNYKLDVNGNTNVTGNLNVASVISSSTGGFRFPDGTVQLTAASAGGSGSITGVTAGTGLTGGGTSGTVTLTNNDKGSAQFIFKNIANVAGTTQFSAASNNDAVRFAGTGGTTVSFDTGTRKITVDSSAITSSQWTTSSGNINYGSGNVGIGAATPGYKLDVAGVINSSTGGFRFPDGTVQLTAASAGGSGSITGVTAGTGLTGGGTSGTVTLTNNDKGSAQFIFKNIANVAGTTQFSAASNNDAVRFAGTGGTTVSFDTGTRKITVDSSGITSSQWTTSGGNINYASGNVGIGITPTEKLHVAGNGIVTGNLTVDGNIAAKYQDVAEWVPTSEQITPGTVVVLDSTKSNQVISSTQAYDTRVAGVISEQPGIALGQSGAGKVLVATTGRLLVKVDASQGPIRIGDLLVTSDIPGVAMKSLPVEIGGVRIHRPGTLIGKALEPLASGTGEILVLLSLQ